MDVIREGDATADAAPNADEEVVTGARGIALPKTAGESIREVLPARSVGLFPAGAILGPASSFYAWRTLLSVDETIWGMRIATIDEVLGLPEVERYLLLPTTPTPPAARAIRTYRPGLVERFDVPLFANETWEVWPPEP